MKFKVVLQTALIFGALSLVSCDGGGGDNTTTTNSTPTRSIFVHVRDAQGVDLPNTKVYYGNDGQHSATTSSGLIKFVTFMNAPVGSYDGHLVLSNNFKASLYGATADSLTVEVPFIQQPAGLLDIGVTINGSISATHYAYLITAKKAYAAAITAGVASFSLSEFKAGDAVTGELIISQGVGTSSAGNTLLFGAAETVSLGQQTFTAQATTMVTPAQSFTANLSAAPATPFLAKINSVSTPAGLNILSFSVGGATLLPPVTTLALPDDVYSANVGLNYWYAQAQNAGLTDFWKATGVFTPGQTMNISPQFTSKITSTAQSGSTIYWVNANSSNPITFTIVDIVDNTNTRVWRAVFKGARSSWTLPTAPQLVTGNYTLEISNVIAPSLTIEDFAANNISSSTPNEIITLKGIAFTH